MLYSYAGIFSEKAQASPAKHSLSMGETQTLDAEVLNEPSSSMKTSMSDLLQWPLGAESRTDRYFGEWSPALKNLDPEKGKPVC